MATALRFTRSWFGWAYASTLYAVNTHSGTVGQLLRALDENAGPSVSSAAPAQLDVDPACVVERCVQFITRTTLLLALLALSFVLFAIFIGKIAEAGEYLLGALVSLCVYGLVKLCCRVAGNGVAVIAGLIVALVFYSLLTVTVTVTMINWQALRFEFADVAIIFRAVLSSPPDGGSHSELLAIPFCWIVSFMLWPAAIRAFRAIRNGALDVFLAVAKFKRKCAHNGSIMRYALQKGFSSRGAWYFFAAIASLLLIPVFRAYLPLKPWEKFVGDFCLLAIAWWCYRLGGVRGILLSLRGQALRGAWEMPIGFTFYLRSFIDDPSEVRLDMYLDSMLGGNLEEIAVMALWPFDPVVCLGRYSSLGLGALRFPVVGDDWQAYATRLFHSANRILLMLSFTAGLAWELHEIFGQRLQGKLILLVPHELPTQKAARWGLVQGNPLAAEQLLAHWNESIGGTPLAAMPVSQLESALAFRFREDGSPISLVSSSRTGLAYAVALRVGCLPAAQLEQLLAVHARS